MTAQPDKAPDELESRRSFIGAGLGAAGVVVAGGVLSACSNDSSAQPDASTAPDSIPFEETATGSPAIEWDMATSWPTSLVTLFGAAELFADQLAKITGGRFKIAAKPAGELVGGTEILPAVSQGEPIIGHTNSYYYTDLSPVQQFGTSVPFGLTQRQQAAWLYEGGGLDLLNDFYAEEHNIITFPCGSTGCQMGGWFTKEINTVDDLNGLRMRIPGVIAGTVLSNFGGEQVEVAAGKILESIRDGEIDAAEFVGPTDDFILGLDQLGTTLYYYYPGWWEPGTMQEIQINLDEWNKLPTQYQDAIQNAAGYANLRTLARYDVLNGADFKKIQEFAEIREFSPELMEAFKVETEKVLDEEAKADATFAEILGQWREYRDKVSAWHGTAELSYLEQQTQ